MWWKTWQAGWMVTRSSDNYLQACWHLILMVAKNWLISNKHKNQKMIQVYTHTNTWMQKPVKNKLLTCNLNWLLIAQKSKRISSIKPRQWTIWLYVLFDDVMCFCKETGSSTALCTMPLQQLPATHKTGYKPAQTLRCVNQRAWEY